MTASQIARYWRTRCVEAGQEMAEREANILLGLRFPELFLERRQALGQLSDFVDLQRAKRGCQSCGTTFVKIRPNQRYCSARCRRREKAHRREATPHGKLVKSRQNKRYRQEYSERERELRRQWREGHPDQYRAQRSREHVRRRINSKWNKRKYRATPPALAGILDATARDGESRVQRDHIDWGYHLTALYGTDYRFTIAKGYGSGQLLNDHRQYGFDPTLEYVDVYFPQVAQGMNLRLGRFISVPGIEAQLAPNSYIFSHSLLYAIDPFTDTGLMVTFKLNDQWLVQLGITAGHDVAPWTPDAKPSGTGCLSFSEATFSCADLLVRNDLIKAPASGLFSTVRTGLYVC